MSFFYLVVALGVLVILVLVGTTLADRVSESLGRRLGKTLRHKRQALEGEHIQSLRKLILDNPLGSTTVPSFKEEDWRPEDETAVKDCVSKLVEKHY